MDEVPGAVRDPAAARSANPPVRAGLSPRGGGRPLRTGANTRRMLTHSVSSPACGSSACTFLSDAHTCHRGHGVSPSPHTRSEEVKGGAWCHGFPASGFSSGTPTRPSSMALKVILPQAPGQTRLRIVPPAERGVSERVGTAPGLSLRFSVPRFVI